MRNLVYPVDFSTLRSLGLPRIRMIGTDKYP